MAESARGPDYLRHHVNVRQRVRNLETGVHPTGSRVNYYDTYGPTNISIDSGSAYHSYTSGIIEAPPRWQRRTGIVMLSGALEIDSGASVPTDEKVASLPPEARPLQTVTIPVAASLDPWRVRIRATKSGELRVLCPDSMAASDGSGNPLAIYLDGAMWMVN